MPIYNKTYINNTLTPAPAANGFFWQAADSWAEGAVPASSANVDITLQASGLTSEMQKVYLAGTEKLTPTTTYPNITTVGRLSVVRAAGAPDVHFKLTSKATRPNGTVETYANNQLLQFKTTDGTAPRITVGAGATLELTPDTPPGDVALLGSPYYFNFGVRLQSAQEIIKDGPGRMIAFGEHKVSSPTSSGYKAAFRVTEGTLRGDYFGPLTVDAGATFEHRSSKVAYEVETSIAPTVQLNTLSGAGTYDIDLPLTVIKRQKSLGVYWYDVRPTALFFLSSSTPLPFTGKMRITSGLLPVNHYTYPLLQCSEIELGQDAAFRLDMARSTTFVLNRAVSGTGIFEYTNTIGTVDFQFQAPMNNFAGPIVIGRARVALTDAVNTILPYTGAEPAAYTGQFSAFPSVSPPGGLPLNGQLWLSPSGREYTEAYTQFAVNKHRKDLVFVASSIARLDGANTTITPGRRLLFIDSNSFACGSLYPGGGGVSNNQFSGVMAAGNAPITLDAQVQMDVLRACYVVAGVGTTLTHRATGYEDALIGSSTRTIVFSGRSDLPFDTYASANGGTLVMDGPMRGVSWQILNNLTLKLTENCIVRPLGSWAPKHTVNHGTVEFSTPAAWGTAPVSSTVSDVTPISAEGQDVTHTARVRYLGTGEDFDVSIGLRLGLGVFYLESSGTKAMKLKLSGVALTRPATVTTVPSTGYRLYLEGTSTENNTLENFVPSEVSFKRRFPASTLTFSPMTLRKRGTGTWLFKGDCPITGDVRIEGGKIKVDSPNGESKLSTDLKPNVVTLTTVPGNAGVLQTLTGTTQKGRHTYEGDLVLSGGILHIGGA